MTKPKVAMDWLAACSGCEMSLLDMDERLVDLLQKIELTSCPLTDLKHPPEEGVEVGVISGAVNNTTNRAVARMMRKRSKCLVALGDCAVFGGVITMRNFFDMEEALKRAYVETESTVNGKIPGSEELGKPIKGRALDQVVKVDISLPGCPPSADTLWAALTALLTGQDVGLPYELLKYD